MQINQENKNYDGSAENAILGAILYDNTRLKIASEILEPVHFYYAANAALFSGMLELHSQGKEISPLELKDFLQEGEEKELFNHLVELLEAGTYIKDLRGQCQKIKSLANKRKMSGLLYELVEESERSGASPEELAEKLLEAGSSFSKTISDRKTEHVESALARAVKMIEDAKEHGGPQGIQSGFMDLDRQLSCFKNGDMVVLAARPAMGKTAFTLNMAFNIAQKHKREPESKNACPVGFFTLEMSSDELSARLISSVSCIDNKKLYTGNLNDAEYARSLQAAAAISEMPLFLNESVDVSVAKLRTAARQMKQQHNIGILFIDYLQLMSSSRNDNRVQEISEISRGVKLIAKELNIPVVILSQLSRGVEQRENKRPMLSDLRDSGAIEQDADVVMFLYREEYYLEKQIGEASGFDEKAERIRDKLNACRGVTELIISKNRKGACGTVPLYFDAATTTFRSSAKE